MQLKKHIKGINQNRSSKGRSFIWIALILPTIFSACIREEVVDFDYQNLKPKLTVYCYLCPQFDTISVFVAQTIPWGEWYDYHEFSATYGVYSAIVRLNHEDSGWKELKLDTSGFPIYSIPTSELPIISGQEYTIQISAHCFDTVLGSTIVPDTLASWSQIDTIGRFIDRIEGGDSIERMKFRGQWDDVPGDYGYSVLKSRIRDNEHESPPTYIYGDGFVLPQDIRQNDNKYTVFTDGSLYGSHFPPPPKSHRFHFYLVTGNRDYDAYQKAIIPYLNDDLGTGDVLGSSFFNSVIPKYYTNLTGGFGTFSAFRYAVDSIDIIQ